jgi:hypothetical protein
MRRAWIVALLCGCGFHAVEAGADLAGAPDLAAPDAALDLAAPDAAAPDAAPFDLARGPDLTGIGGFGSGPLGTMPTGGCCTSDADCRGRRCVNGPTPFCGDYCTDNTICQQYSNQYFCGVGLYCVAGAVGNTCLDLPPYGLKATGDCCGSAQPLGVECAGNLCIRSGAASNPMYCSQGCTLDGDCPAGFLCMATAIDAARTPDLRQCWFAASVTNPSAVLTCR